MSNVVFFQPKVELTAEQNLSDFIAHCQNNLTLYEDQGGFSVNRWRYNCGRKEHTMVFSRYREKGSSNYSDDPMDEPFLSFAKSYVRYRQSERQVTSIGDKTAILRTLHDALINIHGEANILLIDGLVQTEVYDLFNKRFPKSPKLFRFGGQLVLLYEFLIAKGIAQTLPQWSNPWRRPQAKAERTDKESQKWQMERCPSQHQMLSLADCFAKAETPQDRYWSSVLSLLMFAPGRAGELAFLTVDSLHEEEGRLGVRWYGEKGFQDSLKWVPRHLEMTVREAFARLLKIGAPARKAAKFAHDNPGKFYRHEGCITPDDFPENKEMNALEFAHAMNFTSATIQRMKEKYAKFDTQGPWNVLNAHQSKWLQKLRSEGATYANLAEYVVSQYKKEEWPNLPKIGRPVWESLLLIRENEFHAEFEPKGFSWLIPDVNRLNDQLSQRPMKNTIPTIFQRVGIKDEDGSEISMTSHQLRVWLSTCAERGGMDSWKLAQWAGRANINDNRHYDLRTQDEREEQTMSLLGIEKRPTPLEALKHRLPVSYEDLGLDRIGIADVTEYGMCTHDYAMSPCTKGGECMTCKEHVCIKGMPKTLSRIKQLEEMVESQLTKAQKDAKNGDFGADRWETHLGWKLSHIRTQRLRMEDKNIPDGALLWIPKSHDPSPIERSLQQRGFQTENTSESKLKAAPTTHDDKTVKYLLGIPDA
ncbi:hypothetical protein [Lacimicrobium alkaliphilum]|uniref:DNA-binding protein n=1 Tax=Lacimicrobium alkaliphilum TaxID=1526571 RepID=A0ABQ1RA38_9ALTE|nr:hypothetical protein [Lacimicrobium alkaliphilum]GGD61596.1 DNA-binding protein [Lacimicrobium alkaliphilum]